MISVSMKWDAQFLKWDARFLKGDARLLKWDAQFLKWDATVSAGDACDCTAGWGTAMYCAARDRLCTMRRLGVSYKLGAES